ncbi:unnamed protein product [Plutella xylostella]|uniref:(diamondback moth) hypothetical protein n=1 Tax=Plutella xylostella TaxID=51655 RepID=A0A8S4F1U2_PLUXY|nr:unnamed protein product [Plutella xylostella]
MKKSYNVTTVKTISGKVDESESAGHDLNNLSYDDAVEYTEVLNFESSLVQSNIALSNFEFRQARMLLMVV